MIINQNTVNDIILKYANNIKTTYLIRQTIFSISLFPIQVIAYCIVYRTINNSNNPIYRSNIENTITSSSGGNQYNINNKKEKKALKSQ